MKNTRLSNILGATLSATCLMAGHANASTGPSSTAFALSMKGDYPQDSNPADNYPVVIYPGLQITGTKAPYRRVKRQPNGYAGTAWNGPGVGPGAGATYGEIDFTFKNFLDVVTGSSAGVNTAKASVGSTNIVILGNPSGSPALLNINLVGGTINAAASGPAGTRKYIEAGTTAGITLSGTLIGAAAISVPAGKLKPNTVLFNNGTMQIIANATTSTASRLEVIGLEILMANQNLNGTMMTATVKYLDAQVQ